MGLTNHILWDIFGSLFNHLTWGGEGNNIQFKVIKSNQEIRLIKSNHIIDLIKLNQIKGLINSSQYIQ